MSRPLAVIAAELDEVERAWSALRSGEGNPNHDPGTGQFTGAGGSAEADIAGLRSEVRKLRGAIRGLAELCGGRAGGLRGGGAVRGLDLVDRRLSPGRTHKAGSAESILRHCLRSLGLSAAYRRGELTGMQALELLAEVREYGRAWLRHEAEQLIRVYGRAVDDGGGRSVARGLCGPGADLGNGDRPELGRPSGTCPVARGDEGLGDWSAEELTRALGQSMRHHVGRFFQRARTFTRELILAGAMALSGPELTPDDLAEADRQHAVQVAFLDQFERDVAARPPAEIAEPSPVPQADAMTAAEFANRSSMYSGAAWSGGHAVDRRKVIRETPAVAERRFHLNDDERHACGVCLEQSGLGWQPIGTLLPVGDSTCLGIHCDCYYVYRLADGTEFITSRGWRRSA